MSNNVRALSLALASFVTLTLLALAGVMTSETTFGVKGFGLLTLIFAGISSAYVGQLRNVVAEERQGGAADMNKGMVVH